MIAIADGVNHSVLMDAEFTKAIDGLVAAGLVEADARADRSIESIRPQLNKIRVRQDAVWFPPPPLFDRAVLDYLE